MYDHEFISKNRIECLKDVYTCTRGSKARIPSSSKASFVVDVSF